MSAYYGKIYKFPELNKLLIMLAPQIAIIGFFIIYDEIMGVKCVFSMKYNIIELIIDNARHPSAI